MLSLLGFSCTTVIDSIVDQHLLTPRPPALGALTAGPTATGAAAQQGSSAQGSSPLARRHKRSNTYPDSRLAAADLSAPYPVTGLQVQLPSAGPTEAAAAADVGAVDNNNGFSTGLSSPASDVRYTGGAGSSSMQSLPPRLPPSAQHIAEPSAAGGLLQEPQQGPEDSPFAVQDGLWHYNPAYRSTWDLDEQLQQQGQQQQSSGSQAVGQPPARSSSQHASTTVRSSPFEQAAPMQEVELQLLKSKQGQGSSGTGSPLIATSYDGGPQPHADDDSSAAAAAASAAAASAVVGPAEQAPARGQIALSAPGTASAASSRHSSSSTLAQRRSLNITPLAQAAPSVPLGRQETWRSTLSPVPSASYDTPGVFGAAGGGGAGMLSTAASSAAAFGRRSSAGGAPGDTGSLAPASSVPSAYPMTPASRISGFGAQLFSLSQSRLRVSTGGDSSDGDASGEDSSGDDDEGGRPASPTRAQAAALQSGSFRRRPGASMRQIARSVRRMGGALGLLLFTICCYFSWSSVMDCSSLWHCTPIVS